MGWFTDPALQNAFEFSTTPVKGDVMLYAQWVHDSLMAVIPDDNFRNKLMQLTPEAFDKRDRLITVHASVTQRKDLVLNSLGIADLTGIEYFTSLTSLDC